MKGLVPQPQVELVPDLYGADPTQLLQAIRRPSSTDPQRLMVVGHNPACMNWRWRSPAARRRRRKALADNLPTSGLAVLDFAIDDWTMCIPYGQLVQFVSPKALKETSDD